MHTPSNDIFRNYNKQAIVNHASHLEHHVADLILHTCEVEGAFYRQVVDPIASLSWAAIQ